MKFKVGDKVKIIENKSYSPNQVGDIGVITEIAEGVFVKVCVTNRVKHGNWHKESDLEIYEEVEYEDKWHLNDGKVTIPVDADKLEKNGSVVAFRKRKQPEFKFGDMVKHKKTGGIYVVVGKDQEGVHRIIHENSVSSITAFTDNLTKI